MALCNMLSAKLPKIADPGEPIANAVMQLHLNGRASRVR